MESLVTAQNNLHSICIAIASLLDICKPAIEAEHACTLYRDFYCMQYVHSSRLFFRTVKLCAGRGVSMH